MNIHYLKQRQKRVFTTSTNMKRCGLISIVVVLSALQSACFSFGNNKIVEPSQNSYSPANIEHTRQIAELRDEVEELKSLKPQIVKLIKYENEFAYMFEQITSLSSPLSASTLSTPSTLSSEALISQAMDDTPSLQDLQSSLGAQTLVANPVNNSTRSTANNRNDASSVEVGVADDKFKDMSRASLARENRRESTRRQQTRAPVSDQSNAEIDAKFASRSVPNSISNVSTASSARSQMQGSTNELQDKCKVSTGKFAIHLVSYSSPQQADKGWQVLNPKVSDITCNRQARLQEVNVNNKVYYSVRVGPYQSDKAAREVCSRISQRGQYCGVSEYVGDSI
jgi:hypothetical protein